MSNDLTERKKPILQAVGMWAETTTDPSSPRRRDLLRDKARTVLEFLRYVETHPTRVRAGDVQAWRFELERRGLARSTVYAMISKLSSFYDWLVQAGVMRANPAALARPKPPKPYQGETVKALSRQQADALLDVVRARAATGDLVGLRDLALLLFYLETGMRRSEIIRLRWGDTDNADADTITTRIKGGETVTVVVENQEPWLALFAYLEASGRLETIQADDPLWLRHDPASGDNDPLSSYGFVANLKRYAAQAGIADMHLHRTRHTVAKHIAERHGVAAAQERLGHKNQATTRQYTGRLAVRRAPGGLDALRGR